ncbi:MAG TPA: N-acetylmuramoyl-L-alanine amidase [Candidatus Anoxymicrobiaceae bacterium]
MDFRSRGLWIGIGIVAAVLAALAGVLGFAIGRGSGGEARPLVCLDPGHGGKDTGARENGVAEKDVNLDIALRARQLLEARGYRVIMTRDDDTYVSLARRCAIANHAGATVFVSIHNNARPPDAAGTTTYHNFNSPNGERLATYIQWGVVAGIKRPDRGVKAKNLYVLRNSAMPAALLEGVFLTDATDARLITQAPFRQKMAEGVAAGVRDYLNSR